MGDGAGGMERSCSHLSSGQFQLEQEQTKITLITTKQFVPLDFKGRLCADYFKINSVSLLNKVWNKYIKILSQKNLNCKLLFLSFESVLLFCGKFRDSFCYFLSGFRGVDQKCLSWRFWRCSVDPTVFLLLSPLLV